MVILPQMTGTPPRPSWLRRIILIAGFVLFLGLVAFVFFQSGLRYRGQPLEYWVTQLKQGDQRKKALAREALQHFGPSAVPPLIDVLERQDPAWKGKLIT